MELEKMSKYAMKKALQAQQAAEDAKAERKASIEGVPVWTQR